MGATRQEDTVVKDQKKHPSRDLDLRKRGYGIGGGYEKPRARKAEAPTGGAYGAIAHGGYYGTGTMGQPFKMGEATFGDEVEWYRKQYGERTSGPDETVRGA